MALEVTLTWEYRMLFVQWVLTSIIANWAFVSPTRLAEELCLILVSVMYGTACLVNAFWFGAFTLTFIGPLYSSVPLVDAPTECQAQRDVRHVALRNLAGSAMMLVSSVLLAVFGMLYFVESEVEDHGLAWVVVIHVDSVFNVLGLAIIAGFKLPHKHKRGVGGDARSSSFQTKSEGYEVFEGSHCALLLKERDSTIEANGEIKHFIDSMSKAPSKSPYQDGLSYSLKPSDSSLFSSQGSNFI
jgi:hypothetical protein